MIEPLIALIALSLMEIVLGIDNIVFISILTSKLPLDRQSAARRIGLLLALGTRLLLLAGIFWIVQLTAPVLHLSDWMPVTALQSFFELSDEPSTHELFGGDDVSRAEAASAVAEGGKVDTEDMPVEIDEEAWEEFNAVSWRDLILLGGGLFLIYNSVREIHAEVEGHHSGTSHVEQKVVSFGRVLTQIAIMDIIFSLDSVITAVGMADELWIMFAAVILAVGVMILFANQVGNFVDRNPSIKMLALNFLLLIGVMLVAEGIGTPISKGYIYFAMGFALLVESFNLRIRNRVVAPSQVSATE